MCSFPFRARAMIGHAPGVLRGLAPACLAGGLIARLCVRFVSAPSSQHGVDSYTGNRYGWKLARTFETFGTATARQYPWWGFLAKKSWWYSSAS